jgi:manganese/zinc/iron transport system substrate-binding protein
MVGDMTRRIAGPDADVVTLMPTGVDPHLYKASEGDIRRLSKADVIFYNGLALEGKIATVLEKLSKRMTVVAVGDVVPEESRRKPPEFKGSYDPHFWFDVRLWKLTLEPIAATLADRDSAHADQYRQRAAALGKELELLDAWVEKEIAALDPSKRILVTAHDAFGYFGVRYGVDVIAVQGINTVTQAALRDIDRVVKAIVERHVPAIFVEKSVPRRNIEAVQEACREGGHEVRVGGSLYSDSLGPPGTTEGTYKGMVEHNIRTFVEAMRDG